ncbi:hypothetical protein FA95DRAFT_1679866 [Auriscalpium vulgare]|uniref:Uncharacterized protein n=1 Tax=Auriscalpium vulgare TaxID=40419 RepID=A0ACB8RR62_9AGAM|nr:hypothetical protein FA95DRAFT_1679866 [Auriscalpium vulgare]
MDALLRVSPSKVIKAARAGSYPAIRALSRDPDNLIPDAHKYEVIVLLCVHVRKTPIVPRKDDDSIEQGFYGLGVLLQEPGAIHIPDVTDTWPAMTRWCAHLSRQLAHGRKAAQAALEAYMHIIHLFCYDSEMRKVVLATPYAIRFATTVAWLGTDVSNMSPPDAVVTLAQLLPHAPTLIINTIQSSGKSVRDIAARLVQPLHISLAAHPPTRPSFFEAHVWLLEEFVYAPQAASFVPAILSAGAVRCVSRTLRRFSRSNGHEGSKGFIIGNCLRVLQMLLQMGTGIPWIAQSVRHGLLEALVNLAPQLHKHTMGVQKTCTTIVKSILPRYLLFRPVIKAVRRVFEQLDDGPSIALVQLHAFADPWAHLQEFFGKCFAFWMRWSFTKCSHCGKEGHRTAFKRCARCHAENYCSAACQATHWKNSHKAHCAQRLVRPVQLSGLVSVHDQDFHVTWVRYNAAALAASIVALMLAPDASPDRTQYLQSLIIVLNCSLSPWKLGMRRMNKGEREETRTDAKSWVFMESIVVLGEMETRARTNMRHAGLVHAEATMMDYVRDRIPVEYGGRGIYLVGET